MTNDIIDELDEEYSDEDDETSDEAGGQPVSADELLPPFNQTGDDDPLGHITINEFGLRVGREEMSVNAYIKSIERDDVKMGNYVRVPYPPDQEGGVVTQMMFGVITALEYLPKREMDDHRDSAYNTNPGEHSFSYIAAIQPLSIVECEPGSDDLLNHSVDRPPKPGEDVYIVENEAFLRTGLSIPQQGTFLGYMAVSGQRIPSPDNPLNYYLSNPNYTDGNEDEGEPVMFRHTLLAGSTGQGKTHFSKNVLRQYAACKEFTVDIPAEEEHHGDNDTRQRGLNVTVVDPENEYVELGEDNDRLPDSLAEDLAEQGIEVGGLRDSDTDFDVFVPVTRDSNAPNIDGARRFGIPFSIVQGRPELLINSAPKGPTRQAISNAVSSYFAQFNSDEEAKRAASYQDFANNFIDRHLEGQVERGRINESMESAVRRRVKNSTNYRVFDQSSDKLDDVVESMFSGDQVTVIPTGHLRGSVDKLVVLSILTYIVENKIESDVDEPQIKGTPMILALDEAHEYISHSDTQRERYIIENFRQAARRGRKDLFGLYLITQNPQDIDSEIRKQINTRVYLGLERDVVESSDVFVPEDFKTQVTQFDKGQAVVQQPNVPPVEINGLRYCLTEHQSG